MRHSIHPTALSQQPESSWAIDAYLEAHLMKPLFASLTLALAVILTLSTPALAQSAPQFKLGFAALASLIPNIVGQPLEN